MKNSQQLLFEMDLEIEKQRTVLSQLAKLDLADLNLRPHEEGWSALECIAHLNSYADYYIPVFKEAIAHAQSKGWHEVENFYSTWIGRYSIQSILPENRKKRLNSPKQHNHFASRRSIEDLKKFEKTLSDMQILLEAAKEINLNRAKVAIEIMPLLKLRMGDFFPFLILHQSRHLDQAKEAAGLHV